eukprot:tig00000741_g3839.t1
MAVVRGTLSTGGESLEFASTPAEPLPAAHKEAMAAVVAGCSEIRDATMKKLEAMLASQRAATNAAGVEDKKLEQNFGEENEESDGETKKRPQPQKGRKGGQPAPQQQKSKKQRQE